MLSRTERIDDFHLKLSRTEKELYEEFLETEEPEIVQEMKRFCLRQNRTPAGSGSIMPLSGQRSKIELMSGSRMFVETEIKARTWFPVQRKQSCTESDACWPRPSEKSLGHEVIAGNTKI